MADEDDIRELIGRIAGAQRQGLHLTPSTMRLVLVALRFYLAARTWITKPPDPHDDAPRRTPRGYDGPRPTIAESRKLGLVAVDVACAAPNCWNQRRLTFDEIGLPDETILVDIPRYRRFRCHKCGSRRIRVTADWSDHVAQGNGRVAPRSP